MSVSLGGSKGKNKGTSSVDNGTQAYMEKVRQAAIGAGASGPSPLVTGATDYYGGAMKAGDLGMRALSGDGPAASVLMNPYQKQVIGGINNQWDTNDQSTINAVDDRATRAGAFGGSRHGVATGVALGENNRNRNSQVGGLLYQGYGDTMNRASDLAKMGTYGADQNANLGMGGVGNPQQWMMEMMKRGYMGPMGTASNGSNWAMSGAATRPGG